MIFLGSAVMILWHGNALRITVPLLDCDLSWKFHDDVIKWKHFSRCWPFVRGIHRSPVNSPHKGQWRGTLMFSLICLNKRLRKQSWGWRFETLSRPSWRHCSVIRTVGLVFNGDLVRICRQSNRHLISRGPHNRVKFWLPYLHIPAVLLLVMFNPSIFPNIVRPNMTRRYTDHDTCRILVGLWTHTSTLETPWSRPAVKFRSDRDMGSFNNITEL